MTSLLLIAHGSRRTEANADLEHVAEQLRARGNYADVQASYLELAEPSIDGGGALCAGRGAARVVMLPYFLSPGKHVVEDLTAARDRLAAAFPAVRFVLAAPLAGHPLLVEILEARAASAGMKDEG
jgi:sirohydrochlorin ferrochelatase